MSHTLWLHTNIDSKTRGVCLGREDGAAEKILNQEESHLGSILCFAINSRDQALAYITSSEQ